VSVSERRSGRFCQVLSSHSGQVGKLLLMLLPPRHCDIRGSVSLGTSWTCMYASTESTSKSMNVVLSRVFFFFKNYDFSRFLINFSTVVVVKHTHVVAPKSLTHIHSHRDLNSLSLSTESTCLLVPIP
jgi:hypothetical protein